MHLARAGPDHVIPDAAPDGALSGAADKVDVTRVAGQQGSAGSANQGGAPRATGQRVVAASAKQSVAAADRIELIVALLPTITLLPPLWANTMDWPMLANTVSSTGTVIWFVPDPPTIVAEPPVLPPSSVVLPLPAVSTLPAAEPPV